MPATFEYKDPNRTKLIEDLNALAKKEDSALWARVAEELEKTRKNRREVNLWRLNKYTCDGEKVVVPGKILATGEIDHKIEVAAYKFTDAAKQKIEKAGGKAYAISDMMKKNPKGSKIKIIG